MNLNFKTFCAVSALCFSGSVFSMDHNSINGSSLNGSSRQFRSVDLSRDYEKLLKLIDHEKFLGLIIYDISSRSISDKLLNGYEKILKLTIRLYHENKILRQENKNLNQKLYQNEEVLAEVLNQTILNQNEEVFTEVLNQTILDQNGEVFAEVPGQTIHTKEENSLKLGKDLARGDETIRFSSYSISNSSTFKKEDLSIPSSLEKSSLKFGKDLAKPKSYFNSNSFFPISDYLLSHPIINKSYLNESCIIIKQTNTNSNSPKKGKEPDDQDSFFTEQINDTSKEPDDQNSFVTAQSYDTSSDSSYDNTNGL